jgi:hypothetical protein
MQKKVAPPPWQTFPVTMKSYTPILAALTLTLIACSSEEEPKPDPTSGSGGAPSSSAADSSSASTGSGPPDPALYTGGSRLKVRKVVFGDEAAMQIGLFDSQLGKNCALGRATDGSYRCLAIPEGSMIGANAPGANSGYFADAACVSTARIIQVLCAPTPNNERFAQEYVPAEMTCGGDEPSWRVFRATTEPTKVYAKSGMTCAEVAYGLTYIAEEVDPSTFQIGTEQTEP